MNFIWIRILWFDLFQNVKWAISCLISWVDSLQLFNNKSIILKAKYLQLILLQGAVKNFHPLKMTQSDIFGGWKFYFRALYINEIQYILRYPEINWVKNCQKFFILYPEPDKTMIFEQRWNPLEPLREFIFL